MDQISKDIARALEFPDVKERMAAIGFEPAPMTPEEHNQFWPQRIARILMK
jgi:tripartite-type tricarboxylate transporter receptor subunit TctC